MTIYDDFFRSVPFLAQGAGTVDTSVLVNEAYEPRAQSIGAGVTVRDSTVKFVRSYQFNGGSTAWMSTGIAANCAFAGDFVIEAWVRPNALNTSLWGCYGGSPANGFMLRTNATGTLLFNLFNAGSAVINAAAIGSPGALATGTWAHVSTSRKDGVFYVHINGVTVYSVAYATAFPAGFTALAFGSNVANGASGYSYFTGYMEDIRVTEGVGRYTAAGFSPLAWTEAFGTEDPLGPPVRAAYLTAPMPVGLGYGGANGGVVLTPTLRGHGGINGALRAPTGVVTGQGTQPAAGAALTLPVPALVGYGGANARLTAPAPALGVTGTAAVQGRAALVAPTPTLQAAGRATSVGTAALTLGLSFRLVGYSGAVAAVELGMPTLNSASTAGSIGAGTVTLPMFELVASGTVRGLSSGDLIAPMPRLGAAAQAYLMAPMPLLVAVGSATVVATYEAYSINLNHKARPGVEPIDETTHYTQFPFTQIVRYRGSYFGVAADGLYLLEGPDDNGEPTPWSWRTAPDDFGTPQRKAVESCYFGGSMQADTVSLYVGEDGTEVQTFDGVRGANIQNYRQRLGRGNRSRYYAIGAAGTGELDLDDIDFSWSKLTRRI